MSTPNTASESTRPVIIHTLPVESTHVSPTVTLSDGFNSAAGTCAPDVMTPEYTRMLCTRPPAVADEAHDASPNVA